MRRASGAGIDSGALAGPIGGTAPGGEPAVGGSGEPAGPALTVAAIGLAAVDFAIALATLGLTFVPFRAGVVNPDPSPVVVGCVFLFFLITPLLGALVAVRQPRNPAGWLFLVMAFWFAFGFFSDSVARHLPPSPQLGLFATVASDLGGLWLLAFSLLITLFPNGRLPGPRWRIVPALLVGTTVIQLVPSLFASNGGIEPPIQGLPLPLARPDWQPALDVVGGIASVLLTAGIAGTFALVVVRFRRSRGVERQQLKWFAWATCVIASVLLFGVAITPFNAAAGNAAWITVLGSLVLLPVAAGIAILRHRLFDIDLLINRTLVYAALSATLLGVYGASVLLLQQALAPLVATSSLSVAASTLLVAALFQPARRRIQLVVDRRFYRGRYDAERELAAFGLRLRDEVDVGRLETQLRATIDRTVQPAVASIWLRDRAERER